ncbi:hypothetical protein CEUSTIGMA_g12958.t1 [Chlamydomonas eustigma]|uniref:Transcription initiation factor TFIID subunit 9 n=1 Tax=Chlamydomonas eustigma TaxID=1157962 RepID=A0A250XRA5_9CHLO|nr:hypothetical protein CEUSTIGMA_g12958.t1 [Chlamydomonas eustigma]|eukprot:GAX85543.1 hypothetical protein CEUSTIGMA_g12958.t1 [Chlamydomonas eustigma]
MAEQDGMKADSNHPPGIAVKIQQLLESMGANDFEPRVVNQLQDFMFKYVTDTLLDAESYAEHAGKPAGTVEMNDVMLAIQARTAYTFVQPPSQDMLSTVADRVNAREIPKFPAQKSGLLIPEDKDCITSQSYQLLSE